MPRGVVARGMAASLGDKIKSKVRHRDRSDNASCDWNSVQLTNHHMLLYMALF
jgi:hypothetical protein